jgi:hypothetical protein
MVDSVKKEWFALGLILILAGLTFLYFSNTSIDVNSYVVRGLLDNYVYYNQSLSPWLNVSGYFEAGQHFFFNFSKGVFWGSQYDVNNMGLEPGNTEFAPGTAIERYKTVDFDLCTPSGDVVSTEVYVVQGAAPFAVVYFNQSADFLPLLGGNLTFVNVGIEGVTERTGNYTVIATAVNPLVHRDATHLYDITTDPPTRMTVYRIDQAVTKPYFVSSVSAGGVLLVIGAVSSGWAGRPKKRRHARVHKS